MTETTGKPPPPPPAGMPMAPGHRRDVAVAVLCERLTVLVDMLIEDGRHYLRADRDMVDDDRR